MAYVIIICSVCCAVVACSKTQFAYNHADWLLERYADRYLDLTSAQKQRWNPLLKAQLQRHRNEEIPRWVSTLILLENSAADGLTETELQCVVNMLHENYVRTARQAVDLVAPLLISLSSEQIDYLVRMLEKNNRKYQEKYVMGAASERLKNRSERIVEHVERWTGHLEDEQVQFVTQTSLSFPDSAQNWLDYRRVKQHGLVRLLRQDEDEATLHRYLQDWWVNYADQSTVLDGKVDRLKAETAKLVLAIDASLTVQQRTFFLKRIGDLRQDLESLLDKPDKIPVSHVVRVDCETVSS